MALQVVARKIVLKQGTVDIELHEPVPGASVAQIRQFNQAQHPSLATCGVDEVTEEGVPVVRFKPQVGTRG